MGSHPKSRDAKNVHMTVDINYDSVRKEFGLVGKSVATCAVRVVQCERLNTRGRIES